MNDLIPWLRTQLDTDERMALAAPAGPWTTPGPDTIGEWNIYDDHWVVAHAATYDHNDPMSNKPGARGPAYIDANATAAHIATNDPARVLRQVQAHRAILDEYESQVAKADENGRKFVAMTKSASLDQQEFTNVKTHGWELKGRVDALKFAVRTLLSIYSERDGYKEEWSA